MAKTLVDFKRLEKVAKALGDKNRIQILQHIGKKGCINCMDALDVIQLAQPSISHHMKVLQEAGLLHSEKEGRYVRFSLNKEVIKDFVKFLKVIGEDK